VTRGRFGFWSVLRVVVLGCAAYFAWGAYELGARCFAGGGIWAAFAAFTLYSLFLALPPRVLAWRWWVAVLLALPFPMSWVAVLIDEGVRDANLGGIFLLHVPLVLQVGLVLHGRSLLREVEPSRRGRARPVRRGTVA